MKSIAVCITFKEMLYLPVLWSSYFKISLCLRPLKQFQNSKLKLTAKQTHKYENLVIMFLFHDFLKKDPNIF